MHHWRLIWLRSLAKVIELSLLSAFLLLATLLEKGLLAWRFDQSRVYCDYIVVQNDRGWIIWRSTAFFLRFWGCWRASWLSQRYVWEHHLKVVSVDWFWQTRHCELSCFDLLEFSSFSTLLFKLLTVETDIYGFFQLKHVCEIDRLRSLAWVFFWRLNIWEYVVCSNSHFLRSFVEIIFLERRDLMVKL